MLIILDDPDDERLDAFRRPDRQLSDRLERRDDRGAGWFVAEGDLVVARAIEAGCRLVTALADGDLEPEFLRRLDDLGDVLVANDTIRRRVTGFGVVHPVMALFERPARPSVEELVRGRHRIIALEAVDNPINVGSVVRNAVALGWDGLILDHTSADPLARRALRVAMGTTFGLPHARTTDLPGRLEILRSNGAAVIALTPGHGAVDLDQVAAEIGGHDPVVVVVGAERSGLGPEILGLATHRARIPMAGGVDSLNAAAAAAIACYVLRR